MSSLPDPKGFTEHKTSYVSARPKESVQSYDLQEIHDNFKTDIPEAVRHIVRKQSNELVNYDFFRSCNYQNKIEGLFGYSTRDESITIHLSDKEGKIQTVAIRRSGDVKWKTYGSKKYVPYKIEDDFIFLYSGMAEIAIMEMLGLSYIGIQADGMVKHLPEELRDLTADKTIVVLQDNDNSFKKIIPEIKRFFIRSYVLVIDFESITGRELRHGYDFRDLCNEIMNANDILWLIEREIIRLQEASYVR